MTARPGDEALYPVKRCKFVCWSASYRGPTCSRTVRDKVNGSMTLVRAVLYHLYGAWDTPRLVMATSMACTVLYRTLQPNNEPLPVAMFY